MPVLVCRFRSKRLSPWQPCITPIFKTASKCKHMSRKQKYTRFKTGIFLLAAHMLMLQNLSQGLSKLQTCPRETAMSEIPFSTKIQNCRDAITMTPYMLILTSFL